MAKSSDLKYINFDIGVLHLELTSRCNLLCPMCGRTTALDDDDMVLRQREDLSIVDTDPNVLQQLLEDLKPFMPNHVFINGNFGDPIMYPHLLEVVKMFKDYGIPQVTLSTNGSAQTVEWWEELASIMSVPDKVIFAIDGLEDTNHLYRVNSKWSTIMRNAKAFIGAGGRARWDYITFQHNEHQIEEAKQLASDMGFWTFRHKKSNRYVIPKDYKAGEGANESAIENKTEIKFVAKQSINKARKDGKTDAEKKAALETILAAPKSASNTSKKVDEVIKKHKTFENYVKSTDIECQTSKDKSIYVDYQGKVWPCCWSAHYYSGVGEKNGFKKRITDREELFNLYGDNFNDLSHNGIHDILKSKFYSNDLVEGWSNREKRLYICGKTCGKELDFRGNGEKNFEDTEIKKDGE